MMGVIIALLIFGFALIFLEVFLPGGICGVIGGLLVGAGIVLTFWESGSETGLAVTGACALTAVAIVVVGYRLMRSSGLAKGMILSSEEAEPPPPEAGLGLSPGDEGIALSELRPSGTGKFGKQRISVMTDGTFVEAGRRIRIVRVEPHRLIVTEIKQPQEEADDRP